MKSGRIVLLATMWFAAGLPARAGSAGGGGGYSIESHLVFVDADKDEKDSKNWSADEKKVVGDVFKELEAAAPGLTMRAAAYRPVRLYRSSSVEAAGHRAVANPDPVKIGFYDSYFQKQRRAETLAHELTHLTDHGYFLAPSPELARLVGPRCDLVIGKISGGDVRRFQQALADDASGALAKEFRSYARQQGMPSLYSCLNRNESLAELVLYTVFPGIDGESYKAPEDIAAYVREHFLDKAFKPKKYLRDYYDAVARYQSSKSLDASIAEFTRLLSAHPEMKAVYYYRYMARGRKAQQTDGNYEGALSDLDLALAPVVQAQDLYNADKMNADRVRIVKLTSAKEARAHLQTGLAAYKKMDYASALKELKPLAEDGDAQAQTTLGLVYANSQGASKDDAQAVSWFRKASDQSDPSGRYYLGFMYEKGRGVPKDEAEAAKLYRVAAQLGENNAQYSLALLYMNGQGVAKDVDEAKKWHLRAAQNGNAQALAPYVQAAKQGNADAQYFVAGVYFNVEAVKNVPEAVRLYALAANQGQANAQLALGSIKYNGLAGPKDKAEGLKWYRKAADQGNAGAKAELKRLGL